MADIFISYKREEQAYARQLANALERQGWSVWWDPRLRAGERFNDVIEDALRKARCVIVMWSRRSVESTYVKDEATYALNNNKLIPIKIEVVDLPFRFEGIHTPQLVDWDGSEANPTFQTVIRDLTSMLGPPPTAEKRRIAGKRAKDDRQDQAQHRAPLEAESRKVEEVVERKACAAEQRTQVAVKAKQVHEAPMLQQAAIRSMVAPKVAVLSGIIVIAALVTIVFVLRESVPVSLIPPQTVEIPAGCFQMGSRQREGNDVEKPQHRVCVKRFALGKYEVTFDEYDRFAKATNREWPNDRGWGRGRQPVIYVSWNDAVAYAQWLSEATGDSYRLPSEAEWEYAARGGTTTKYWWGDDTNQDRTVWACCDGCGSRWDNKQPAPVGSFPPNPFGVHDTAGNVGEWVEDCLHDNYNGAPTDGSAWLKDNGGDCAWRVLRGGAWDYQPTALRSAERGWVWPDGPNSSRGFRLARDL